MTVLDIDGLRRRARRMSAQGESSRRRGGVPVRLGVWLFHMLLPLAGLWLLLAVPAADVRWEHHPSHFWLVFLVAVG